MKHAKAIGFTLVGILGALAVARPPFVKDLQTTYGFKPDSAVAKARCGACHVRGSTKLNAYGIDIKKAMTEEHTKTLTGSVLKKVEGLDSDKDGKLNRDELHAGTNPGDPSSK